METDNLRKTLPPVFYICSILLIISILIPFLYLTNKVNDNIFSNISIDDMDENDIDNNNIILKHKIKYVNNLRERIIKNINMIVSEPSMANNYYIHNISGPLCDSLSSENIKGCYKTPMVVSSPSPPIIPNSHKYNGLIDYINSSMSCLTGDDTLNYNIKDEAKYKYYMKKEFEDSSGNKRNIIVPGCECNIGWEFNDSTNKCEQTACLKALNQNPTNLQEGRINELCKETPSCYNTIKNIATQEPSCSGSNASLLIDSYCCNICIDGYGDYSRDINKHGKMNKYSVESPPSHYTRYSKNDLFTLNSKYNCRLPLYSNKFYSDEESSNLLDKNTIFYNEIYKSNDNAGPNPAIIDAENSANHFRAGMLSIFPPMINTESPPQGDNSIDKIYNDNYEYINSYTTMCPLSNLNYHSPDYLITIASRIKLSDNKNIYPNNQRYDSCSNSGYIDEIFFKKGNLMSVTSNIF
jgi:hypothetical protein